MTDAATTKLSAYIQELEDLVDDWLKDGLKSYNLSSAQAQLGTIQHHTTGSEDRFVGLIQVCNNYESEWVELEAVERSLNNYSKVEGDAAQLPSVWDIYISENEENLGKLQYHAYHKDYLKQANQTIADAKKDVVARNRTLDWWEKTPARAQIARALAALILYIPLLRLFTIAKWRNRLRRCFHSCYKEALANPVKLPRVESVDRKDPDLTDFKQLLADIQKQLNPSPAPHTIAISNTTELNQRESAPSETMPTPEPKTVHNIETSPLSQVMQAEAQRKIEAGENQLPARDYMQDARDDHADKPREERQALHAKLLAEIKQRQSNSATSSSTLTAPKAISAAEPVPCPRRPNLNANDGGMPAAGNASVEIPPHPFFMASLDKVKPVGDIIQAMSGIDLAARARAIAGEICETHLNADTIKAELLKDNAPEPTKVDDLNHRVEAIINKLITTLLTKPQKLESALKGQVRDVLAALLSLNQRDSRKIIKDAIFAKNLAGFVPQLILDLVRACTPVAAELANASCATIVKHVSNYAQSVTGDDNSPAWLKIRASEIKLSIENLQTTLKTLTEKLMSAIATSNDPKKPSLTDWLWPLYRYGFKGSKPDGKDDRTKRFVRFLRECGLNDLNLEGIVGIFFYEMTPCAMPAPENGQASWTLLVGALSELTNKTSPSREAIDGITANIETFVQASQDFHGALFSTETNLNIKETMLAYTFESKVVTIFRMAHVIFGFSQNSTVESPNPELTCEYISHWLSDNREAAQNIVAKLKADPLVPNNPTLGHVDRSLILKYIKQATALYCKMNPHEKLQKHPKDLFASEQYTRAHTHEQETAHKTMLTHVFALCCLTGEHPLSKIDSWSAAIATSINHSMVTQVLAQHAHLLGGNTGKFFKDSIKANMLDILKNLIPKDGQHPRMFGHGLPQAYRAIGVHLLSQWQTENVNHAKNLQDEVASCDASPSSDSATGNTQRSSLDAVSGTVVAAAARTRQVIFATDLTTDLNDVGSPAESRHIDVGEKTEPHIPPGSAQSSTGTNT